MSIARVDDAELVGRARLGDAAAFGELVDRHRLAVYRAALAALGARAEAEDVCQDTFLAAYRRLDSFRGDSSFKTWLLTIAWNQAINHRRRLSAWWRLAGWPAKGSQSDDAFELPDEGRSPEQTALDTRLRIAIRDEIRSLPRKIRDVFLLALSGDYSYEEIGAMLGMPVGTIKWRMSEARRRLRTRLAERGYCELEPRSRKGHDDQRA